MELLSRKEKPKLFLKFFKPIKWDVSNNEFMYLIAKRKQRVSIFLIILLKLMSQHQISFRGYATLNTEPLVRCKIKWRKSTIYEAKLGLL